MIRDLDACPFDCCLARGLLDIEVEELVCEHLLPRREAERAAFDQVGKLLSDLNFNVYQISIFHEK